MGDLVLETERLVLRSPAADDLPWLLEELNTPAVMRYLGGAARPVPDVITAFEADILAFRSNLHFRWTVWLRQENRRIGRCGLIRLQSPAAPAKLQDEDEIGWTLAEDFWGHGYAAEAANAVISLAFGRFAKSVLYAQTSDSNGPSTRLMGRLGFTRRAELDYVDPLYPPADNPTTIWSLSAQDWRTNG